MPPDQRTLDQLSLSRDEYDKIVDLLDREPNEVELGMFGALWSEHCGYKNSCCGRDADEAENRLGNQPESSTGNDRAAKMDRDN